MIPDTDLTTSTCARTLGCALLRLSGSCSRGGCNRNLLLSIRGLLALALLALGLAGRVPVVYHLES